MDLIDLPQLSEDNKQAESKAKKTEATFPEILAHFFYRNTKLPFPHEDKCCFPIPYIGFYTCKVFSNSLNNGYFKIPLTP